VAGVGTGPSWVGEWEGGHWVFEEQFNYGAGDTGAHAALRWLGIVCASLSCMLFKPQTA
jgi:hypothetical protein